MYPEAKAAKTQAALVFFVYLFFFSLIFFDIVFLGMSFQRRDISFFYYPIWQHTVASILDGQLPLWNPLVSFGAPFLANVQNCVLYPLTIFLYLPDFTWGFNFYILFHLALGAFFTYLWARDVGQGVPAAFVAGFAYSMSGFFMSTINLTISLCSAAYLPLILLVFRRVFERGGFFWIALGSLVLLMQYLAGDPSIFFGTALVLALFSIYKSIEQSLDKQKLHLAPWISCTLSYLFFLCLGAVQIFPFFELLSQSSRPEMDAKEVFLWSVYYNDLLGIVIPFFTDLSMGIMSYWERQSWLDNYYAGITVILLAGYAFWHSRKNKIVSYHALLLLLGLGLGLGKNTLIYPFLYETVPFFSWMRYPVRLVFFFYFSLAMLAGFGVDHLMRRSGGKTQRFFYIQLFVLVGAAFLSVTLPDNGFEYFYQWIKSLFWDQLKIAMSEASFRDQIFSAVMNVRRSLFFSLVLFLGIMLIKQKPLRRSVKIFFLMGIVILDLGSSNVVESRINSFYMTQTSSSGVAIKRDIEKPGLSRFFTSAKTINTPLEYKDLSSLYANVKNSMIYNGGLSEGLYDSLGYDSIYLRDIYKIQNRLLTFKKIEDAESFHWLNIQYVLSPSSELSQGYRLLHRTSSHIGVFKTSEHLPRAFLSKKAQFLEEKSEVLEKILAPDYKPKEVIYIDGLNQEKGEELEGVGEGADDVQINYYSPNRVNMSADTSESPWLFMSDSYYPGWRVFVDGKEQKIYKANYAFRAIRLSPGKHQIEWIYDPLSFKVGLVVSLLSLAALIFYYLSTVKLLKNKVL